MEKIILNINNNAANITIAKNLAVKILNRLAGRIVKNLYVPQLYSFAKIVLAYTRINGSNIGNTIKPVSLMKESGELLAGAVSVSKCFILS